MASSTSSNLLSATTTLIIAHPILLILGALVLSLVYNKIRPGLRSIPGPPLAAYTKLWRMYDVFTGQAHLNAVKLHDRYGPVVRIGPNHVSLADPEMIPIIYNTKENFTKTGFYPIQTISLNRKVEMNIFGTRDLDYHRVQKRKMGAAYSLPNVLQSESGVDSCISLLIERLNEYAAKKTSLDLGAWLHYFAFDVGGEITFAQKLGFLEQGKDVGNIIKEGDFFMTYASVIGQVPELHRLLLGNPLLIRLMAPMEKWNPIVLATLNAMNGRASIKHEDEYYNSQANGRDMLSRWAHISPSDPIKMNSREMTVHLATNIFAGSDTIGGALGAIFYFLCRNRKCMDRFVAEIDGADKQGKLSRPITHKEATTSLPYLGAVIKEAMRVHPVIGLLLERHVPAEGLHVPDGYHIPGGTVVGLNPWVVCRAPVFGAEPEKFNPDRWLNASESQLREMETIWEFNFGAGSRKCLGRKIAWMSIHKVVPELLRQFHVELTQPEKEWRTKSIWFVPQEGIICNLTKR